MTFAGGSHAGLRKTHDDDAGSDKRLEFAKVEFPAFPPLVLRCSSGRPVREGWGRQASSSECRRSASWRWTTDNGLLAPELAAGIQRVKSAKSIGVRAGNWLSLKQAQALLNAPDITTTKGLRDRAIIAVLLGCALRRSEVAALTMAHVQQRDGRWCIVD